METISLKKIKNLIEAEATSWEPNVLYISDDQAAIDYLLEKKLPVAAFEHDGITGLKCEQILIDADDIDDEDIYNIYLRCKGLPITIAETERTIIRELAITDVDKLFKLYENPEITEFMEPLYSYNEEIEYEKNYIKFIYKIYGYGMWLIFDKISGELIGRAGIENRESCFEDGQAELGYCIVPNLWKQGYAYEVCSKIVEIADSKFGLKSLIARCDKNNEGSIALLKKLGFEEFKSKDSSNNEELTYYKKLKSY